MKFQALGLPEALCHALEKNGITEPTAIQQEAIPVVLTGRDLISSAKTGSGKTLAFALPVITRLLESRENTALILVPTREIAVQVQQVMDPYMRALGMPPAALVIGGVSFGPQIRALKARPPVIISTPGRLNDHIQSSGGRFRLDHVSVLVLDEADRMLDMGFLPQVKQIVKHLTGQRQTLLFSATMPSDLAKICREMMHEPARVTVDAPNTANAAVEQRMLEVPMTGKANALLEAIGGQTESVLVFTRTKRRTDRVAKGLVDYGVKADRIHGDRSQAQRQKAIEDFRSGRIKVLVATDIAARGLDIPLVELVVNFDLPEMKEDYVHRIGRTGRAGATGVALSFVLPEERGHWAMISQQKKSHNAPGFKHKAAGQGHQQKAEAREAAPAPAARPEPREERREPRKDFAPKRDVAEKREAFADRKPKKFADRPQREFREDRPQRERREWKPTNSSRPFGRGEREDFRAPREDRGAREPREQNDFEAAPREHQAGEWTNARSEKPWRQHPNANQGGFAKRGFQPRGEFQPRAPREGFDRDPRQAEGGKPSRFQRWGAKKPQHIFTGREGDQERRGPRANGGGGGQRSFGGGKPRGDRGAPGARWNRDRQDRAPR